MKKLKFDTVYWLISRVGGFDGVSLQTFEYIRLLNEIGIKVRIITGNEETQYGHINYFENNISLLKSLGFNHLDSRYLYKNSFTNNGGEPDEWKKVFEKHKEKIKKSLEKEILQKENSPVIAHNMISLRHMHSAAACAVKELIEKYPNRSFVNFAPDSDWERPGRVEKIKEHVREAIASESKVKDGFGPYNYKNLYHIVLNHIQKAIFIDVYKIDEKQIFEIPDIIHFESKNLKILKSPEQGFLEYLSENCVFAEEGCIKYKKKDVDKDMVYFLCPVRPIKRKKIRIAIFLARQFAVSSGKNVSIVITHPNVDERIDEVEFTNYFFESVLFANKLGVNLIYLGGSLKLAKDKPDVWALKDVYNNMAALNSIGMVTSNQGGWENSINEILRAGIPLFMNRNLNSYALITKKMGIKVLDISLAPCYGIYDIIKNDDSKDLKKIDAHDVPEIKKFVSWAKNNYLFNSKKRNELVKYNYHQAYLHLSSKSKEPEMIRILETLDLQ